MEQTLEPKKFSGISGSTLKIIAIILMFIDHVGAAVFERGLLASSTVRSNTELWESLRNIDIVLRKIGRPSFPIFCFLLVEGFLHTKDTKKYALRLGLFALISEIPFDLAIRGQFLEFGAQNVFFTLFIGLLVMMAASYVQEKQKSLLQLPIFAIGLLAAYLLKTDYSYRGILLIIAIYVCRFDKYVQAAAGAVAVTWELPAPLAFLPILFYNGKRGISMRYFFYWFYPVHLLLLAGIARVVLMQ